MLLYISTTTNVVSTVIAVSLGIKRLVCYGDSSVVVNQINKDWDTTKENMDAYCTEIRKLEKHFNGLEFHYIHRENNLAADALSKMGSHRTEVPSGIFVQELIKPSIKELTTTKDSERQVLAIRERGPDWRTPFIEYLTNKKVPGGKDEEK